MTDARVTRGEPLKYVYKAEGQAAGTDVVSDSWQEPLDTWEQYTISYSIAQAVSHTCTPRYHIFCMKKMDNVHLSTIVSLP
jgi:hypothetical protein